MDFGVFIPIANNGWITSTTSPHYMLTFDDFLEGIERFGRDVMPLLDHKPAALVTSSPC